jgi:hypothetical protein
LIFKHKKDGQCSVVCLSVPVVLLRIIEKTWKTEFLKIMLHDVPTFISILPNEYTEIKNKIIKKYCNERSKLFFLVGYRSKYGLSNSMIEKYMKHFSEFQIVKARLVCLLPIWLATLIQDTKQFIKSLFFASKSTI